MDEEVNDLMSKFEERPDGFAIIYSRATDQLYFGPFETLEKVKAWVNSTGVGGLIVPLYRTVNWSRR